VKASAGSREGAGKDSGQGAQEHDGRIRSQGNFPGDGFADYRERKNTNDAEGAQNGNDIGERNAFAHRNVGDGNVERHRNGQERAHQRHQNDSANRDLSEQELRRKNLNHQCSKQGGQDHQREGNAENVPETFQERTSGFTDGPRPCLGRPEHYRAGNGSGGGVLARRHQRGEYEDQEEHGSKFHERDGNGKQREGHGQHDDVQRRRSEHGGQHRFRAYAGSVQASDDRSDAIRAHGQRSTRSRAEQGVQIPRIAATSRQRGQESKYSGAKQKRERHANAIGVQPVHCRAKYPRGKRHARVDAIYGAEGERSRRFNLCPGMIALQQRRIAGVHPEDASDGHHKKDSQTAAAP